jgi:hypothetical protein
VRNENLIFVPRDVPRACCGASRAWFKLEEKKKREKRKRKGKKRKKRIAIFFRRSSRVATRA